jgi:hypothetical protein
VIPRPDLCEACCDRWKGIQKARQEAKRKRGIEVEEEKKRDNNTGTNYTTAPARIDFRCSICETRPSYAFFRFYKGSLMPLNRSWECGVCCGQPMCVICTDNASTIDDEELTEVEFLKTFYCKKHFNERIDEFKMV